ncbi:hypothetical protein BIW11_01615 [Tropilaelaps mercedesae]|uniref:Uncharacterized protein n=1 Tax=Tropilaelaps mercedesae TaxID=418985 RepID=A0A1V9XBS5_9ACAR|nr:hypothetical protein BIW11_01615 [Tropilaelaps mercedesae]
MTSSHDISKIESWRSRRAEEASLARARFVQAAMARSVVYSSHFADYVARQRSFLQSLTLTQLGYADHVSILMQDCAVRHGGRRSGVLARSHSSVWMVFALRETAYRAHPGKLSGGWDDDDGIEQSSRSTAPRVGIPAGPGRTQPYCASPSANNNAADFGYDPPFIRGRSWRCSG